MRKLRTEEEIIANWKIDPENIVVSICCITYNHESYIEDALEGFLIQETDFPFEIIIHEDASTDKTAGIIRKYEAKYPKLIKPIYQKENQHSKGTNISHTFNYPRAKGDYIAICEGDDYWVDPYKLQIQIDEMEKYPNLDMCFHPAQEINPQKIENILSRHSHENKIFDVREIILGGGSFCITSSIIVRKKCLLNLPKWFYDNAPVGDVYIQIYGAMSGGALYLNRVMSVYRRFFKESWSMQISQNINQKKTHHDKINYCHAKLIDEFPHLKKIIYKKLYIINRNHLLTAVLNMDFLRFIKTLYNTIKYKYFSYK